MTGPPDCAMIEPIARDRNMSCYFRHIKDLLGEAGIAVTPENKESVDRAIHRIVRVRYKKCMPDCWTKVKKWKGQERKRRALIAELKKTRMASERSGRKRRP